MSTATPGSVGSLPVTSKRVFARPARRDRRGDRLRRGAALELHDGLRAVRRRRGDRAVAHGSLGRQLDNRSHHPATAKRS
jgi:hypothetical protein